MMNERIFIHTHYDEDKEIIEMDWSPVRNSQADVEYILATYAIETIKRLLDSILFLKLNHLSLNPSHKNSSWIVDLERAERLAYQLIPEKEEL